MHNENLVDNKKGLHSVSSNFVLLGPTPVNLFAADYSWAASGKKFTAPIPVSEKKLLKKWKQQDLALFYYEQRSNRR